MVLLNKRPLWIATALKAKTLTLLTRVKAQLTQFAVHLFAMHTCVRLFIVDCNSGYFTIHCSYIVLKAL